MAKHRRYRKISRTRNPSEDTQKLVSAGIGIAAVVALVVVISKSGQRS